MPKINLKRGSPEYAEDKPEARPNRCEMAGCGALGEHKAPKHRGLNEYYMFCLDHVKEYNKAWNFFEGMAPEDVEEHTINAFYGERPTWKYGVNGDFAEDMRAKAWQFYKGNDEDPRKSQGNRSHGFDKHSPEFEALAIMGMEPPFSLDDLKVRYKELAKKHHPDLNGGCSKSEEVLKSVNMAYTLLKVAYEQFEKLPERS